MKVIEAVAADSERKGMFEESVKLYDLAGKHEKVIGLLNKLLSQVSLLASLPHASSFLWYYLVTANKPRELPKFNSTQPRFATGWFCAR